MSDPQVTFDASSFQPLEQSQAPSSQAPAGVSFDQSSFQPIQQTTSDLTANTVNPATGTGYGLYQMVDPSGKTASVPFNNVTQAARNHGYQFLDDQERWKFNKDYSYATTGPGHEQEYAESDRNAPLPMQAVSGVVKGIGSIGKPVMDVVGAAGGVPQHAIDSSLEAQTPTETAAKVGTIGAVVAPAAIAAPVATAVGAAASTVAGSVGQVLGQHLGLNDKQTALLSDLFAIAGGVAGGVGASKGIPAVLSKVGISPTAAVEGGLEDPIAANAQKLVDKSGVEANGTNPAPPSDDTLTQINQSYIKRDLHASAQDAVTKAGVDYTVDPEQPVLNMLPDAANAIKAAAKQDYAIIDEASGNTWTNRVNRIENLNNWLKENAGVSEDEKYFEAEAKRDDLIEAQKKMLDDLKASGKVDPAIADRAAARFKQASALGDIQRDVQAAFNRKSVLDPMGKPISIDHVNPDVLATRLAKRAVPNAYGDSRLQQAFPDGLSTKVLHDVTNAQLTPAVVRQALPLENTGKAALLRIIEDNSKVGKVGRPYALDTDWGAASKQLEGAIKKGNVFSPEDAARARKLVYGRLRAQNIKTTLKVGAGLSAAFTGGNYLIHHVLQSAL